MTKKRQQKSPIFFFRGEEVDASYTELQNPIYCGNPFLESLPPPLSEKEAALALNRRPEIDYNEEHRKLPPHERMHLTSLLFEVFQPWAMHTDVFMRLERVIWDGLRLRNPFAPRYFQDVNQKIEALRKGEPFKKRSRSSITGFTILGTPGMGKSCTIEESLLWYPQIINHSYYKGKDFNIRQIVWLKLNCPFDGSIKGLVLNFFQTVDDLLGTEYYKIYCRYGRKAARDLIPDMVRVASIHCIGVLVIDEIQALSRLRSGGHEEMLNFFVELRNRMGIPIILIGTPRAKSLSDKLHQMRRDAGVGDIYWQPIEQDECWNLFLKSIWRYQYISFPTPLTQKLNDAIYYESQGIIDFAVKIYMLSQIRAIVSEREKITVGIIKSAAKDDLNLPAPVLNALKTKNWEKLDEYGDVFIDKNVFIEMVPKKLETENSISFSSENQEELINTELEDAKSELQQSPDSAPAETIVSQNLHSSLSAKSLLKSEEAKANATIAEKSLLEIASLETEIGITPYHQSLLEAGYIRSANEFLLEVAT